MPSPAAFSRFLQPFTDGKFKPGKPLRVMDADGTVVDGVMANPWSLDETQKYYELSNTGDIIDVEGNVILAREGEDAAGTPVYRDREGRIVDQSIVDVTRGGELDGIPIDSNPPDLPPVDDIEIEYDASAGVQPSSLTPRMGLTPRQFRLRSALLNEANNLGGDLINNTGEGVSNKAISAFNLKFSNAPMQVQESLLEGADEVTRARVLAALAGRADGVSLYPRVDATAQAALENAEIARQKGDAKAYVRALQEFQSFPVEEQEAARSMANAAKPPTPEPVAGGRIVAQDWQPEPEAFETRRALRAEEEQLNDRGVARQPGRDRRSERLRQLVDEGRLAVRNPEQPGREASLLETPRMDPRTQSERAAEKVAENELALTGMRSQLDKLAKNVDGLPPEEAQGAYDALYEDYVRLYEQTSGLIEGYGTGRRSQLETAQGLLTSAAGYTGPQGQLVRTSTSIDAPEALILQEEALASGEPTPLSDLPQTFSELVMRGDLTHGDENSGVAGGKVRGGRSALGDRADAMRKLFERQGTARVPKYERSVDHKGRVVYDRVQADTPDGLIDKQIRYNVPAGEIFGGSEMGPDGRLRRVGTDTALFPDINALANYAIGLMGNQYGKSGSLGRQVAKDEIIRVAEHVFGPRPESMPMQPPSRADIASLPAQSSRQEFSPDPIVQNGGLPPEILNRVYEEMLDVREQLAPGLDVEMRYDADRGWHVAGEGDDALYVSPGEVQRRGEEIMASDEAARNKPPATEAPEDLPDVEGNLEASAAPIEDVPPSKPKSKPAKPAQAATDESLPPVEGDLSVEELEAELTLAREDAEEAYLAGDEEGAADAHARADEIIAAIERASADQWEPSDLPDADVAAATAPPADDLPPVDGNLEASATPVDDVQPSKPAAKSSKPKPKPQPAAKSSKPKPKPKPKPDESLPPVDGKLEESAKPVDDVQPSPKPPSESGAGDTSPSRGTLLRRLATGAAAIGLGVSLLPSRENPDQPVSAARDSMQPNRRLQRGMSEEERAALEAKLNQLRSNRRPYQTAHTPIGRGSF